MQILSQLKRFWRKYGLRSWRPWTRLKNRAWIKIRTLSSPQQKPSRSWYGKLKLPWMVYLLAFLCLSSRQPWRQVRAGVMSPRREKITRRPVNFPVSLGNDKLIMKCPIAKGQSPLTFPRYFASNEGKSCKKSLNFSYFSNYIKKIEHSLRKCCSNWQPSGNTSR